MILIDWIKTINYSYSYYLQILFQTNKTDFNFFVKELMVDNSSFELVGPVRSLHQFVDMSTEEVEYIVPDTRQKVIGKGCKPAMGHTFSSGTIDGPGLFSFETGSKNSNNPLWNLVRNVVPKPSFSQVSCHAEKTILISTGEVNTVVTIIYVLFIIISY